MINVRPCQCDRCVPGGAYREGDCRNCWLWHQATAEGYAFRADCVRRAGGPSRPRPGASATVVARVYGPRQPPALWRRLLRFVRALFTHAKAGFPEVSAEARARRIALCEACEHFTERRACRKCGCGMDVKVRWAEQSCPVGKWPAAPPTKSG